MHVFLTGATGYIGSAVLDSMIKGGHRVTAMARDPEKAEKLQGKGAATVIGELGLPKTYVNAVKAADAVVHAAMESSPRGRTLFGLFGLLVLGLALWVVRSGPWLTWLGLTLAQTFVHQHQGVIECESRPGCTDFRILLPLP